MSKKPTSAGGSMAAALAGDSTRRSSASPLQSLASSGVPVPHCAMPASGSSSANAHLSAVNIHKMYKKASLSIPVLEGVDLEVKYGEFLAIVGQSGSGKSTLLHLLGTLDAPTLGEIHFLDRRIDNLPSSTRERLRNEQFGMIFQFYHLLPELTMLENVLTPLMIGRSTWSYWRDRRKLTERAKELLETVGLSHRLKHKPRELSGGEMQRVAIARALINKPQLLLADEPTGNLDEKTGREILKILRTLNREQGLTIVMVTHDMAIAATADRTVKLVGGKVAKN
jgi:lipoprotein-releasing system ATP-binding protein